MKKFSQGRYVQLKFAASLRGVTVHALVEEALNEFFTNHPELLPRQPPRAGS
jgi:hypothetical protein